MPIHHIRNEIDRIKILTIIQALKENIHWIVDIKKYRSRRTLPQNSLYWVFIACISSETGNDKDALHDYFREKFLGWEEYEAFGEAKKRLRSTTKLTTKEFKNYLESIHADMATEGINLLFPEDRYFEEFYNAYRGYIG